MSLLLRRARPLLWVKSAERRTALLPTSARGRRQLGTVKVILTDDVSGTGYRSEYVEIRGGFMRNFLFPSKRAIYATDDNRLAYEAIDRTADKERAAALKALKRGRQELSGITIVLQRNMPAGGKGGMLPGQAVRAKDVSGYLRKNSPFEVTEEEVRLPGSGKPITALGQHTVLVRTKLSESETAILARELGAKELEEKAWVQVDLTVEQMSVGGKGKRRGLGKEEDAGEEEEAGEEGEEGEEGEKKTGDMSV
ncbi:unnamed protein product [Ectocarpus sp. CCAP 1310/34]|nr:unnamed protein product [Ectocarpus sp. CCAP 1310/34]